MTFRSKPVRGSLAALLAVFASLAQAQLSAAAPPALPALPELPDWPAGATWQMPKNGALEMLRKANVPFTVEVRLQLKCDAGQCSVTPLPNSVPVPAIWQRYDACVRECVGRGTLLESCQGACKQAPLR